MRLDYKTSVEVPTYITPLVGDLNNDGNIEVVSLGMRELHFPNSTSTEGERSGNILIFEGKSGQLIREIETPLMAFQGPTPIVIGDTNNDGNAEIIISTLDHPENPAPDRGILICYNYKGEEMWRSNTQIGDHSPQRFGAAPALADFNQDGVPEVYIYNEIYNAQTGVRLASGGDFGIGLMGSHALGAVATTIAADLTSHPGLELAAGRTIYEVTINNPNGYQGNMMSAINAEFSLNGLEAQDGYTAIVDIDLDGQLDVVVTSGRKIAPSIIERTVYAWNPRDRSMIASYTLPHSDGGALHTSIAFIGDINGDGKPNIGVCTPFKIDMFEFSGTDQFSKMWEMSTNDLSGQTKLTMFDFNQNGTMEIIYRDETDLMVIDGSGIEPRILKKLPSFSNTGAEGPVVADVNNDGSAQLLVTGNASGQAGDPIGKIEFFTSSNLPWAPARKVWNQYAYFNVNIRDDLSIPKVQPDPGSEFFETSDLCPQTFQSRPLHNFLVQSTYYDEIGCPSFPTINASVAIDLHQDICLSSDAQSFDFSLTNVSSHAAILAGFPVSLYDGDPGTGGILLETKELVNPLAPLQTVTLNFSLPSPWENDYLFVVANEYEHVINPQARTSFLECNYENNIAFLAKDNFRVDPPEGETIQTVCFNSTLEDLSIEGDYLIWYDKPEEGLPLAANTSLTDGTTYYVGQQRLGVCESQVRLPVLVQLQQTPPPSGESRQNVCGKVTLSDLELEGVEIKWYDSPEAGQLLDESHHIESGTTYYASQTLGPCESTERLPVETFVSLPILPIGERFQEICGKSFLKDLIVEGENIKWYGSEMSLEELNPEQILEIGKSYYSSQTIHSCESERLKVTVQKADVPSPDGEGVQYYCLENATVHSLVVAGENIRWYKNPENGTPLSGEELLEDGEIYYASQSIANCESRERLAVLALHSPTPTPSATPYQTFCEGNAFTLANLTVNGDSPHWFPDLQTGVALPLSTTLEDGRIYYAANRNGSTGCWSEQRTPVQVSIKPCGVEVFNAITLKANQKNDYLKIKNITYFPDNSLEIYNRYGKLVYFTEHYGAENNLFYGESNVPGVINRERKLPTGTYLYVLTYSMPDHHILEKVTGTLMIINDLN